MKNECRRNLGLNTNFHGLKNFVLTPIIRAKQRFVSRTHSLCTSTHIVAQSHMYYQSFCSILFSQPLTFSKITEPYNLFLWWKYSECVGEILRIYIQYTIFAICSGYMYSECVGDMWRIYI